MRPHARDDLNGHQWAFVALALLLAGIHLYLGLLAPSVPPDRAAQFALLGAVLFLGPVVFFTPYWRPILYLLGAVLALSLGVLWAFTGAEYLTVGLLTGVVAVAMVLVGTYSFLREWGDATGA